MGLPYYKRFPRDFLEGTAGLPFETKAAYGIVLDLIYMHDGRLPDDPRYIAGQLGCSVRLWKGILTELIAAGKLNVAGGVISNFRADYLTEMSRKYQDKMAENAGRPRKFKDLRQPKLSQSESESESVDKQTPNGVCLDEKPSKLVSDLIPTTAVSPSGKTKRKPRSAVAKIPWPDGFDLDGDLHRYATDAGIAADAVFDLWERFRSHHVKKGNQWAGERGWRAAWEGWCRNEIKFSRERRERNGGRPAVRAGYDPIDHARRQLEKLNQPSEDERPWFKRPN